MTEQDFRRGAQAKLETYLFVARTAARPLVHRRSINASTDPGRNCRHTESTIRTGSLQGTAGTTVRKLPASKNACKQSSSASLTREQADLSTLLRSTVDAALKQEHGCVETSHNVTFASETLSSAVSRAPCCQTSRNDRINCGVQYVQLRYVNRKLIVNDERRLRRVRAGTKSGTTTFRAAVLHACLCACSGTY